MEIMMQTMWETAKQQRVAWSCAVLVGMFLTVFGRAPVLPVVAGCILAIAMATLRSRSRAGLRGSK
jgi:predicted PurR-regulated permease PerM